ELLRCGELAETKIHIAADLLLHPEIEEACGRRGLDPTHEREILQSSCAELAAVNLVNAGVHARARPASELFHVGVDDDSKSSVVPGARGHAAAGISKAVAVVREGEL